MANTLFIVEDKIFVDLPPSIRNNALVETKRLFAFISKFQVVTRQPAQFPAAIDFTDSIIKLVDTDDEVSPVHNQSVRQQLSNIRHSIKQNGFNPPTNMMQRFPATPERGGVGFQQKEIISAGPTKLAMTLTGGIVSLETVKAEVVEVFAGGRTKQEILADQDKAIKKKGLAGYYGKHQALVDTRGLFSYELLDKILTDWPTDYQDAVGIALGRIIAHEARHQYILPHFSGGGLGASEAVIWGDKNFEQFDKQDQSDISIKIQQLQTEQRKASIQLETFPRGQPFPF